MNEDMTLKEAVAVVLNLADRAAGRAENLEASTSPAVRLMAEVERDQETALRLVAEAAKNPLAQLQFVLELQAKTREEDNSVTNSLISTLEYQLVRARAELELIQEGMDRLIHSDYSPSTRALEIARYPTPEAVTDRVLRLEQEKVK